MTNSDHRKQLFLKHFGAEPEFDVRAPGRVNLIGEHIDYAGLNVLPLTLTRAVTVLVAPRADSEVHLFSSGSRHAPFVVDLADGVEKGAEGNWSNYPRAALAHLMKPGSKGFNGLVFSDLPEAAGLSSSSALVVATGMAALAVNDGIPLPERGNRLDIRTLPDAASFASGLARAEAFTGTMGGGMDQAASVFGVPGSALLISFDPLSTRPIPIPDDWVFLVAHSMVRAEKSGGAQGAYNTRRNEALGAAERLSSGVSYRNLLTQDSEEATLRRARHELPAELLPRFRHVLGEGHRVLRAVTALEDDDPVEFGKLMNASHRSLAEDYEVSHPALDQLVHIARRHGALGARLTGAGFGGATVLLTTPTDAPEVTAALDRDYYRGRLPVGTGSPEDPVLSSLRFVVKAGGGAALTRLA